MVEADVGRLGVREGRGRTAVAEAANVLARLGLVTAYGHVSARAGEAMLITPAADLADVTASQVIAVPLTAAPPLPAGVPAEAWAHLALYRARPDAAAIARAQPASGFAAAATTTSLVPLHGQAAWLGESVPVHDSAALLRSPELAERAARLLAVGEAMLLRGNGAITLGATPGLAVARMWVLAAACEVYLAARGALEFRETMGTGPGTPYSVTPLSADEIASWRAAGDELLPRLWQHLRRR
jgi:HCOMODA/2-hydroxy-3-carboxy-muconic semialdehyde decarboxylase